MRLRLLLTGPRRPLDAFRIARERGVLPSALGSQEQREQLAAELRSKSVFSARVTSAVFLEAIAKVVNSITGDQREAGDERVSGMSMAEGRVVLREVLDALGYTPEGGFKGDEGKVPPAVEGTLQDLRSRSRLDLILRTQVQLMQGAGQKMRGREVIDFYPAWELVRYEEREVPRDWRGRFEEAGGTVLEGRLVAHKNDPVWSALGDSAFFDDALDVDHPPFAFSSGMGWREVRSAEWMRMGGVDQGEPLSREGAKGEDLLLPGNVASVGDAGTLRAILRDFDRATADGSRVTGRMLLERDSAAARRSYAKRYGLDVDGGDS